jgi:uracil-DNA glycosylase family 4
MRSLFLWGGHINFISGAIYNLNTETEIKDILGQLKNMIEANRDMGLEPPPIPKRALHELNAEAPERPVHPGQSDQPGSLEALRAHIGDCRRCKLHKGRKNLVFGEGSPRARLVFVGEGPGRDEDRAGRPFVGEAGVLLTRIIEKGMGLTREDVYICNVVKCHPPENRDPERDEIEACLPFLKRQLSIIQPEVICALGRIASQELLEKSIKITQDRGQWHSFMGVPLMPTYHPAYIIRNPARERELKGHVWEDVKKIMNRLGLEVKER